MINNDRILANDRGKPQHLGVRLAALGDERRQPLDNRFDTAVRAWTPLLPVG
jgi:hypothetical protein